MSAWIASNFLKLLGWQIVGQLPETHKIVLITVPHTSNWDFMYMYLVSKVLGVRIRWMGKEELFKGPLGPISRALGGIPVKRSHSTNMVAQMIQAFQERDELILAVPPAATRSKSDYWRSGFYYIAMGAQVPITMGFLDYPSKRAGFGPTIVPSGDIKADMDKIRAFYADIQGKFPEDKSVIRLKAEEESPTQNEETAASPRSSQ